MEEFCRKNGGIGYAVYGAQWTDDFGVVHGRADSFNECKKFCGSKYVQSNLGSVFKEVEEDLRKDRAVLFSGTPCQVGAIKTYLKSQKCEDKCLITMDIACHGTPQSRFWNEYKLWLEKREGSKLKEFSFRYKPKGWKGYPVLAVFENGKRYENSFLTSHYVTMFRKGLLMRPGCFNCKYPGHFKSDITIADLWGVEICMPDMPIKDGVSLVLCHTEEAQKMLERIGGVSVPDNMYLKYNSNLSKHTPKPQEYDVFWSQYNDKGIDFVIEKYGVSKLRFNTVKFLRNTGLIAFGKKVLKKA